VTLVVRFLRDRYRHGRDRRWSVETLASGLGLSARSVHRALYQAERAGLLAVRRKPGCKILAADVTIRALPDAHPARRPLYGPIPWWWLAPALRLSVPAIHVAMACWLRAGWERSADFELALGDWAELGLSRPTAGRGLASLEAAGLVTVERRPGRSPVVTLLDEPATRARDGA
jgi:DNA-binding transcriptional ArsR family regulator